MCKCKQNTQSNMKSVKASSHIKSHPYEDVPVTDTEKVIANAISNINLDKDVMYRAKSQWQYDTALEDLKSQMDKIKSLASPDAYRDLRNKVGRWYKATLPYLKWDKTKTKPSKSKKPTGQEMLNLNSYVERAKISKCESDVCSAFIQIDDWFNAAYAKYPKATVDKVYGSVADRLSFIKATNPIVNQTLKKATG